MGGIPSFDSIGAPPKKKKPKATKPKATKTKQLYTRINPDDLSEKVRVTKDDPRYDEWLSPTQARREGKSEKSSDEKEEPSTWREIGKSIGKEVKKELGKGTRKQRSRIKRNVTKKVTDSVKSIDAGKVGAVASFAARFAAAVGVAWLAWKVGDAITKKKIENRVQVLVRREESARGRPYTPLEMQQRVAELGREAHTQIVMEDSERLSKSRF